MLPLAEFPLTPSQVQVLIYVAIAAVVVGGLGSIKAGLDIIRFFRGDPSPDRRYASKEELAALRSEIEAVEERAAATSDGLRQSMREIFTELRTINKSIGRIEGHLDGHKS